jgi:hypothetical protein
MTRMTAVRNLASQQKTQHICVPATSRSISVAKRILLLMACAFLCGASARWIVIIHAQDTKDKNPSFQSKLALQPEADRLRRRLGLRFLSPGREDTILSGLLTVGAVQSYVQIARMQDSGGEQVAVSLGGGKPDILWTSASGAVAAGLPVRGEDRAIIERIVLDSADQFIQAQMRGATYVTIGRRVRPEAAGSKLYSGPTWDVIMIIESATGGAEAPLSRARLYYINTATGLLDKVISKETGETIVAEFSGWTKVDGELDPRQITWRRNGQVIMQLTVDNFGHGSRQ